LTTTARFFLDHYVDAADKEVFANLNRDGSHYNWTNDDTSKCNEWKNGYHSTEHALILYMFGKNLERKDIELYFAVSPSQVDSFVARPYFFLGREKSRQDLGEIAGMGLRKVKVVFDQIY
jgi:hypothetical protein